MPSLLRVDASARVEGSHSRALGDAFSSAWAAKNPGGSIILRDLVAEPIPQIESCTIAGFYTPANAMNEELLQATSLSDRLIEELQNSDELLVTTPMYNFTIPASLKAWIDQIVRIGRTFDYDGSNFTGLVTGKTATIAIAYGAAGYSKGGALAAFDLTRPYLQNLLGFLGFVDVRFVTIEATTGEAGELAVRAEIARRAAAALAV